MSKINTLRREKQAEKSLLAKFLGSAVRAEVLIFFFANAGESFYCKELEDALGRGHAAVWHELKLLVSIGVLVAQKRGLYHLNVHDPKVQALGNFLAAQDTKSLG